MQRNIGIGVWLLIEQVPCVKRPGPPGLPVPMTKTDVTNCICCIRQNILQAWRPRRWKTAHENSCGYHESTLPTNGIVKFIQFISSTCQNLRGIQIRWVPCLLWSRPKGYTLGGEADSNKRENNSWSDATSQLNPKPRSSPIYTPLTCHGSLSICTSWRLAQKEPPLVITPLEKPVFSIKYVEWCKYLASQRAQPQFPMASKISIHCRISHGQTLLGCHFILPVEGQSERQSCISIWCCLS